MERFFDASHRTRNSIIGGLGVLAGLFLGGRSFEHHTPGLAAASLTLSGLGLVVILTAQGSGRRAEVTPLEDALNEPTVDLSEYTVTLAAELERSHTEFLDGDGEPLAATETVPDHPGDDPAMRDYIGQDGRALG